MALRPLTPIEARVLATLVEKARTVPDSYPLSLNSLVLGCNQKSSRDPVMDISNDDAQAALESLKALSLVFEASSSRVVRYQHNLYRVLNISEPQGVLLALLMLRGPQTPAELRTSGERWYKFADTAAVETVLQELQARGDDGGLQSVQKLPRAPGAREQRWMHLLGGEIDVAAYALVASSSSEAGEGLLSRVTLLENTVAQLKLENEALRAQVQMIAGQLGIELNVAETGSAQTTNG
jgi:uncharacterized protein YceH (UPF0502 family)